MSKPRANAKAAATTAAAAPTTNATANGAQGAAPAVSATSSEPADTTTTDDGKAQVAQKSAAQELNFVELSWNAEENAQALQQLMGETPEFPFNVVAKNTVAMPLVLPVVPGFSLGHVAGPNTTRVVQIRSADQLHTLSVDIQEILTLNDLKGGVKLARTEQAADE